MKRLWTLKNSAPFALTALASLQAAPSVDAAPVPKHRYTFNDGTATDIISGANGTLVDPSGIAFYSGGQVNLTNNNNFSSNQNFSLPTTQGAYIDLPNGLISGAANSGLLYQFSLEFWATVQTNRDWARLGDFGTSNGGENTSGGASASDYLIVAPRTGGRANAAEQNKLAASTHSAANQESMIPAPAELSAGVQHHIVVTVDQTDISTFGNGVLRLYLDGALVNSGPVQDLLDFTLINDNNNWLGRAQWGDPLFDGSYNEFSVYDYALNGTEVGQSFSAGPVPGEIAVPQLVVNRDTGVVTVNNATGEQLSLLSYSITSDSGSLDPVTWTSIDANAGFDPNGTWTKNPPTHTPSVIGEGTTGDGGQIAAATGRTIGSAWNPSPYEDLDFTFTLVGGTPLAGEVVYIGNDGAAIAATDLDADGDTDAADFSAFALASQADLTGMSDYQLYKNGDLNGDGKNNYVDFRLFKDAFIAANGAPAFAALMASVPEPTSLLLAIGGAVGLAFRRR